GPPTMEYAEISLSAAGTATVLIGTKNHGQGHETTFTQLVCEKLNLGLEDVSIVDGDTARIAFGNGTFGSRSSGIGGAVLGMAADDVIKAGRQIAAHLLEAGEGDVVFENGAFTIAGSDRAITLKEVARAACQPENLPPGVKPGLSGSAKWAP